MSVPFWRLTVPGQGSTMEFGFVWNCRDVSCRGENLRGEASLMGKNSYFNRKLHSLLGVIPVGFFLIEHLLTNFEATKGPEAFVDQINWLNSLPLVLVLEIVGIWIPLLYHAVYGLYVAFTARNNVSRYGYFRNQMFLWQRITGVLTFLFVAWHFFETRFQVALGNVEHERLGQTMHDIVSQPLLLTIYVIGVIAASFHFYKRHVVVPCQLGHHGGSTRPTRVFLYLDRLVPCHVCNVHRISRGI